MPQYDGLDELDSSLFSSQTLDREWGYQNQHPISDQFPWFGSEPNPEGYNAAQTNEEDYLLGIDFNLLVNQPFHHFNSWNFGGGFKSSSSLTESELPVSNSNIPGPSNGCFAEISTDPNSPAHVQQPPANLATIEPSPLGPTPNRPCQSSGVNQPASQNEKSQRPNGFIESTSQQATDQQIWLPSAGASLGLGPQFPSVSVVPQIAVHVPPRIYPIIVPRVTALQPIPTKHCNPSATNTRTQKLITSPSTLANTQITEVESISTSPASFDACITVFETTPGALTKVKRRRKLDPTGHKSFKVTRKIGSCLECRFRKRPCNPGNPCEYCVKVYGSPKIAQLICHRESPFVSYDVTDYFLLSSGRRIIDFNLKTKDFHKTNTQRHLTIDGRSGPCSLPLKLPISWQPLDSLPLEDQAEVWRTKRLPTGKVTKQPAPGYIAMIPESDDELGGKLETWAIRYSHKFSRFYSKKYPTAYAFSVGWMYASKKLPEHELVALLLRCAALAYVLRAGVKCPASEFHTIQARIDTLLYRRLRTAESTLYAALQKLVWVSAGRLKREQLWPVAYILWQQMRSICLRSSHVDKLVSRSKGGKTPTYITNVDKLSHCFNLLLSTHTALFRSHSPIIMDFTDPANQDVLGADQEMMDEAMKLRKIILDFREHSLSRPFKSSNWYKDTTYGRFRKVLNGRGGA